MTRRDRSPPGAARVACVPPGPHPGPDRAPDFRERAGFHADIGGEHAEVTRLPRTRRFPVERASPARAFDWKPARSRKTAKSTPTRPRSTTRPTTPADTATRPGAHPQPPRRRRPRARRGARWPRAPRTRSACAASTMSAAITTRSKEHRGPGRRHGRTRRLPARREVRLVGRRSGAPGSGGLAARAPRGGEDRAPPAGVGQGDLSWAEAADPALRPTRRAPGPAGRTGGCRRCGSSRPRRGCRCARSRRRRRPTRRPARP